MPPPKVAFSCRDELHDFQLDAVASMTSRDFGTLAEAPQLYGGQFCVPSTSTLK